jgi:hypothetical protein
VSEACSRIVGNVKDAPFEVDEHIVSKLAVVFSRVEPRDAKSPVKDLFNVGKIIAMVGKVPFSLAIVPRAARVSTHAGILHNLGEGG